MIQRYCFFICVFCMMYFQAQTHRFVYEMKYKEDSLAKDFEKEYMNLDINPNEVKFYPRAYAETDSLNKIRDSKSTMWSDLPALIRKRNSNATTQYFMIDALYALKSEDNINWKLHQELKTLGGYQLQKATTTFGGRNWTAWFAKDINVNEGPYKFRGLPGLVFDIADGKGNYIFTLVKSYQLKDTYDTSFILERFSGQKPISISQKILTKKMLDDYNDPLRGTREAFKENTNPNNTFWINGTQVKSLDQFKDLSANAQKRIREHNNPIEIDKAVRYPMD